MGATLDVTSQRIIKNNCETIISRWIKHSVVLPARTQAHTIMTASQNPKRHTSHPDNQSKKEVKLHHHISVNIKQWRLIRSQQYKNNKGANSKSCRNPLCCDVCTCSLIYHLSGDSQPRLKVTPQLFIRFSTSGKHGWKVLELSLCRSTLSFM